MLSPVPPNDRPADSLTTVSLKLNTREDPSKKNTSTSIAARSHPHQITDDAERILVSLRCSMAQTRDLRSGVTRIRGDSHPPYPLGLQALRRYRAESPKGRETSRLRGDI